MADELVVDITRLDLGALAFDQEAVRGIIPQRYDNENVNGVIWFDCGTRRLVGFKDVRADEFWVRGHFPGRPRLPETIMIEAAAQLTGIGYKLFTSVSDERLLGFAGLDDARFLGVVTPPARLLLLGAAVTIRRRLSVFRTQCVADGSVVFEGTITGIPM